MRYLGEGRSSVVFAVAAEELARLACFTDSLGTGSIALRVGKTGHHATRDATCNRALSQYVGLERDVPLTSALREALLAVEVPGEATRTSVAQSTYACVLPDFTVNPAVALRRLAPAAVPIADWSLCWSVELKPKAFWFPPRVVGIEVDGVDHQLDPLKLWYCRFALHQRYKCPSTPSPYCPNEVFCGSRDALATALHQLQTSPQNNFRILSGSTSAAFTEAQRIAAATSLQVTDAVARIRNLQQFGSEAAKCDSLPVLDIELLFRWREALDKNATRIRWIVREPSAGETGQCSCQRLREGRLPCELFHLDAAACTRVPPGVPFEEAERCFYVSTTARDASIILSVATAGEPRSSTAVGQMLPCDNAAGIIVALMDEMGDAPAGHICRVAVVDIDTKRHKPLQHYFNHDQMILAAARHAIGATPK